jgi:hypothetical protein
VSDNISSNRLLLIACIWASSSIRIGHDLVCDDHCNPKLSDVLYIRIGKEYEIVAYLIGEALKSTQELPEMILTRR